MSRHAGVWIDHQRAVIVLISEGHVATEALESGVDAHERFSGDHVGGGEKHYEQQFAAHLARYYDEVILHLHEPRRLLILGPGQAKSELQAQLARRLARPACAIDLEPAGKLTDGEIVTRVQAFFGQPS